MFSFDSLYSNQDELLKLGIITVVLFRESIAELKLPETPEQDKNVFRIPVGMPATSSTSMEDEDLIKEMSQQIDGKSSASKGVNKRKATAPEDGEKLSDSDDPDLKDLLQDQSKAEKHKRLFDVQPYEPFSCFLKFNPFEMLPRSRYVAHKLWKNEDGKYTGLRNMQNRNLIIFF